MNTRSYSRLSLIVAAFLLIPLCGIANAEEEITGSIEVGSNVFFTGGRDSAKFEEYREVPSGLVGSTELNFRNDEGYFIDLEAQDIAEDDQEGSISAGKYGSYEVEVEYNQTPHRFAYGAETLYSGIGSEVLTLSDGMREDLEDSTTLVEIADRLDSHYVPAAFSTDIELERKKISSTITVTEFDPVTVQFEVKNEQRDGTRPWGGNFGFFNAVEIVEPIDYDTTEFKLSTEYAQDSVYFSAHYYASVFDNNLNTLTYDNPFVTTDSTGPQAYLSPRQFGPTATIEGPTTGLADLVPDNLFQQVSLTGSVGELPLDTRISATASWGWMEQDEDLVAYTTNTAIVPGAIPGDEEHDAPFDASNPANLPTSSADREVFTQLYNLTLTSKPLEMLRSKIRYRYYQREDDADEIHFPGYVRMDAVWQGHEIQTEPIGYDKHNVDVDFSIDVLESTSLGLGYGYERWSRDHREVSATDENILRVSLDSAPSEFVSLRTSYELSVRDIDGDYDPTVPFHGAENIPQMPQLRKYDLADRDKNEVQVLLSVFPIDNLSITGGFTWAESDYDKSTFGLVSDEVTGWSVDTDYGIEDCGSVFAFWSYELYEAEQRARQWTPGGLGDPHVTEPGIVSNSNWSADTEDEINTIGAGVNIIIVPDVLTLKTTYTFSDADGTIDFASPLGTEEDDINPFIPVSFDDVDDIKIHTLNPKLTLAITENLSLILGYLWERYEAEDINKTGYKSVPRTAEGAYNASLLMGTLPYQNYEVNVGYAKVSYDF